MNISLEIESPSNGGEVADILRKAARQESPTVSTPLRASRSWTLEDALVVIQAISDEIPLDPKLPLVVKIQEIANNFLLFGETPK